MDIKRSEKLNGGVVVHFDNGWYYAHGIITLGEESDAPRKMGTMWGWVNHLKSKRWWNSQLEAKFIREVSKHF